MSFSITINQILHQYIEDFDLTNIIADYISNNYLITSGEINIPVLLLPEVNSIIIEYLHGCLQVRNLLHYIHEWDHLLKCLVCGYTTSSVNFYVINIGSTRGMKGFEYVCIGCMPSFFGILKYIDIDVSSFSIDNAKRVGVIYRGFTDFFVSSIPIIQIREEYLSSRSDKWEKRYVMRYGMRNRSGYDIINHCILRNLIIRRSSNSGCMNYLQLQKLSSKIDTNFTDDMVDRCKRFLLIT